MTTKELIEALREEGFSASDIISIIAFFLEDITLVKRSTIKQHANGIRRSLERIKAEESLMLEELFK